MKDATDVLAGKRPGRGSLKANDREVDQDFQLLSARGTQRSFVTKRFNKKAGRCNSADWRRRRFDRQMESLEAILGLASLMHEGSSVEGKKEDTRPGLSRGAAHVAIAQYIKVLQMQSSTTRWLN
jgi:hypothetical protein